MSSIVLWQRAEYARRIAQAGLEMGGLLHIGSVYRDEGRLEQAIAMFEQVAAIGESVETANRAIQRFKYGAYHRLAELLYQEGQDDRASRYCESAIRLADDLARKDPDNLEWRRLQAFSLTLRGRQAAEAGSWQQALASFTSAADVRAELLASEPGSCQLISELAFARQRQAQCCVELDQLHLALKFCEAAYEMRQHLVEREPDVAEHVMRLSAAANAMGAVCMSWNTAERDEAALVWFTRAERSLIELRDSGRANASERDFKKTLDAIRRNKEKIEQRARDRENQP